jgi:class 3 adenylate cyclase/tetratricopeptide (TPR) repeat protein
MECPVCGETSHERIRVCPACGAPLPVRCPECQAVNARGASFCVQCGARLSDATETSPNAASEPERRQLSVVFCDLVDSTPLSGRLDPEDLVEVIRAYQSRVAGAIAHFGGYIARYVGDGVLSYFGWPESQEADPERTVSAALAIVAAVTEEPIRGERLRVRVGIATGVVVVGESIGSDPALPQTAVGETPNRAARLQEIADPNCIVIDEVTRKQIGDLFVVSDLGECAVRGFPVPLRVWRVLGARAVDDRFAALHTTRLLPLVNRERELAILLCRWRRAAAGHEQLVLLSGEPGIGKSRLVVELRARLRDEPHASLRYFCSPHYQASPLHPIIARLEHDAGFVRSDGPREKLRKLETVLLPAGASAEDIELIADLLGVPASEPYQIVNLNPQPKKQKTFDALTRWVIAAASQAPLLLVAEDLHWADPSSLELLDRFVNFVTDLPILLIFSYRPEFVPPWIEHTRATHISLNRLSQHDAKQLATAVTSGNTLVPTLLDRIVTRSEGIPLFIEELTKSVLENSGNDGGWPLSLSVPVTLQSLLTARLDKQPAAKRVAQIGATIGREFSQSLIAAVARIPDEELMLGLEELVDSGLASRHGEPANTHYVFKHALVQEAIYDSLLRRRRADMHARIVAAAESDLSLGVVEPGLLGYHCAQAGSLAKAASYYRIAGGHSAERAAAAETITYLERGLQFVENLREGADRHRLEAELLIALGRILMATKGPNNPQADMAFRRAVEVCRKLGSPENLARALYSRGIIAETRAELDAGQAIGEELRALAVDSGDAGIAIAAHVRLGVIGYYRGNFVAAGDHFEKALALCATGERALRDSAIASDPHVAEAYLSATLAHLGYIEQAITHGKSAVNGAQMSGSLSPAYALVLSVWSRTLELLRDDAQCGSCAALLVTLCREQGFSLLLGIGLCQLGWATATQGGVSKGLSLLSDGVASLTALGAKMRLEVASYLMSDVLVLLGRHGEALTMLEQVLEFSRQTEACWLVAELHRKKGELLLACAETNSAWAEQEFRQAIDIARSQSAKLFELRAATNLARLWSVQGRRAAAQTLLQPVHAWFTERPEIPDVRESRALLATLDAASQL